MGRRWNAVKGKLSSNVSDVTKDAAKATGRGISKVARVNVGKKDFGKINPQYFPTGDVGGKAKVVVDKVKTGSGKVADGAKYADEVGKKYTPTFRKGIIGGGKLAGKGIKKVGGAAKTGIAAAGGYVAGQMKPSTAFNNIRAGGSNWWIFFAVLLYLSDIFFTKFDGFKIDVFITTFTRIDSTGLFRIFLNAGVIAFLVGYAIFKKPDMREFLSFFIFIELVWLIITFGGYSNIGVWLHLAFAGFLFISLISPAMPDKTQANLLMVGCIFVDFFLFSLIANLTPNLPYFSRLIIPIWVFLALGFTRETTFKKIAIFLIIMFYVFNAFAVVNEYNQFYRTGIESLSEREIRGASAYAKESWDNMINFGKSFGRKQLNNTLGEYYTGDIDSNAEQKLGVYLQDIRAADTEFYEDQPVSVWGTLSAQTLDKPVNITVGCKTKKKDVYENVKIYPQEVFEIGESEEEVIECLFEPGLLKDGLHEIILSADFNFLTNSYIKTYFMDPETKRSLKRSGIDPLVNYGIFDGVPTAIYTSGPIMMGLAISSTPPLDVNRDFRLGITLTNGWEGKLKNVTDIHIITPIEIEMSSDSNGDYLCRGKKEYTFKHSNCQEIGESEDGCDDVNLHNVYIMDTSDDKKSIGEIEFYETLWCDFEIVDESDLLGDVPLSTKYFKVAAKYDYHIYQSIGIEVKGGDGVRTVLEDGKCSTNCEDSDGCLCPDGCVLDKLEKISVNANCGGISDGEETIFEKNECSINCVDLDGCICPEGCNIEEGTKIDKDNNCGGSNSSDQTSEGSTETTTNTKPSDLSIKINSDNEYTSTTEVTLSLEATDAKECAYLNPSDNTKEWKSVSGEEWEEEWTIKDPIEGEYWVWFYCRNDAGEAPGVYDTIKKDNYIPLT